MKRFTETGKWLDPWYRKLSPVAKLLWSFVTDNCDCTGTIELDVESASFHIGAKIEEKHVSELGTRVERTSDGKLFIPRFISFQYGELSESCPAHKPVFKLLTQRQISKNGKGHQYPSDSLALGLSYPTGKERIRKGEGKSEGEKSTPSKSKPFDQAETIAFCVSIGLPCSDGEYFWNKWVGNGFQNAGKAVRNWQATIRSWKAAGHCPSQKTQSSGAKPWQSAEAHKQAEIDEANRTYRLKKLQETES